MMKMTGLAPNQYWPTDFFRSSLFLQPHINSEERYLGGILNFVPKLKLRPVFKKSFKFQSQNLGIQLWTLQFSKFQNFL
jgi:hypothetical protein